MKITKLLIISLSFLLISISSYSQDQRTTETKIADLLARLPANDLQFNNKLMGEMLLLGENGIKQICNKIIPPGTGDDTSARFAIESLSRFLSQGGKDSEKVMWEKICISYALGQEDYNVKDFFIKQLQMIGGDQSIEAMKIYLANKEICEPALAVISAIRGKKSETILAETLKNKDLPCAASVMNLLAMMNSQSAINEYISFSSSSDLNIKASAYNALAQSGSTLAYPVLSKAAKKVSYKWERTGATASLLNYARNVGKNGNIRTADKICKLVISKCNDDLTIQNKTSALDIYASIHGLSAMPELIKATSHPNKKYRNSALSMSLSIPGNEVTKKWIDYFPKAKDGVKAEIIAMLGTRRDTMASSLVTSSISNQDFAIRSEAAKAVTRINGEKSVSTLINYMLKFNSEADQEVAKASLQTVAGSESMSLLIPVLKSDSKVARKSVIELLAWNKDNKYFSDILPFASSADEQVKTAAIKALASLAEPCDQTKLIELLDGNNNLQWVADLQTALSAAAGKISDPDERSSTLLNALEGEIQKEKIIPVLANTGGKKALTTVLNEFKSGNPGMRDVCFKALINWCDYSASSALYEICSLENKKYEGPAFNGYITQIKSASLPDDQKLLLYRKILPYAINADRKNEILTGIGKLKTYQSLFFVANYLDDPTTSSAAAQSAMSIALPSFNSKSGLYGELVKEILNKVTNKLVGPESSYNIEKVNKYLATMPADEGFQPMFNGKDLTGWQGLVENPVTRAKMKPVELAEKQIEANKKVEGNWSVKDGCIWFSGSGNNLCSIKEFGDFELLVDWKISKMGDSGIYLRGTPQVQIWDTSRVEVGAQVGSGGLYNNKKNPSKPLKIADNPIDDWNTFRIVMIGEKVTAWLNGELVVDNVTLENYWDHNIPIFPKGAIELQAHGNKLAFRDIYVRKISEKEYNLNAEEKADGFVSLLDGRNINNRVGNKGSYEAEDAKIVVKPS